LIKSRQQVWGLALYTMFKRIFERKGVWTADSEFKIGWTPPFQRDFKDLANVVDVLISNSALSKRTAREMFGIDHSIEVERLKTQKTEEPQDQTLDPKVSGVPSKVQPPAETPDSE